MVRLFDASTLDNNTPVQLPNFMPVSPTGSQQIERPIVTKRKSAWPCVAIIHKTLDDPLTIDLMLRSMVCRMCSRMKPLSRSSNFIPVRLYRIP